jgi:imidazolonepropionase
MPAAIALAVTLCGLTPHQAIVAATINAAYSLDRHERIGSLQVGKELDAVVVDGAAIDLIRVGAEMVRAVIKKGIVVHARR